MAHCTRIEKQVTPVVKPETVVEYVLRLTPAEAQYLRQVLAEDATYVGSAIYRSLVYYHDTHLRLGHPKYWG